MGGVRPPLRPRITDAASVTGGAARGWGGRGRVPVPKAAGSARPRGTRCDGAWLSGRPLAPPPDRPADPARRGVGRGPGPGDSRGTVEHARTHASRHAHSRARVTSSGCRAPVMSRPETQILQTKTQILQKIKEIQVRKFFGPPLAVVVVVVVYCLNTLMELGDVVWSK